MILTKHLHLLQMLASYSHWSLAVVKQELEEQVRQIKDSL